MVSPKEFEDDVRRIARYLWPSAAMSGAKMIDGQERDGYFETDECIYIIESTCDRKIVKIEKDTTKIQKFISKNKGGEKAVIGYIVTLEEPTADQREVVRKACGKFFIKINILSFSQFQSKIVDAKHYLTLRNEYFFGSIHNPITGKYDTHVKYIDGTASDQEMHIRTAPEIAESISTGEKILLVGDYGAGKSMTLREVYKKLVSIYYSEQNKKFPIYINLREHQKQFDIDEILERHAKKLGFEKKSSLVCAWNLGYCHLILDGFDEMMSTGVRTRQKKMRDVRYNIVKPIRDFIAAAHEGVGIVIAGRQSYFDTTSERTKSLGTQDFIEITLDDFTQEHIEIFLKEYHLDASLPSWIPTRPLLLGTLLLKGYLSSEIAILDPAVGWDLLLNEIALREAKIESPGVDAEAIRLFLEVLAIMAQSTDDGLGALSHENITSAFFLACEYEPDEDTLVLLLRLPGLGYDPNDSNIRKFIDKDFADACAAGFLFNALLSYSDTLTTLLNDVQCHLSEIGYALFEYKCKEYTPKQIGAILNTCLRHTNPYIKHNAVMLSQRLNVTISEEVFIQGIGGRIQINGDSELKKVTYSDCIFETLDIDGEVQNDKSPYFKGCYFEVVDGMLEASRDIMFDEECEVGSFSQELKTTNAIMNSQLDTQVKVLVSILKKLYIQKGAGRLESAFLRGLDTNAKRYVSDILRLLQSEGLAIKFSRSGKEIWLADKKFFPRVGKIVSAPMLNSDELINKALQL